MFIFSELGEGLKWCRGNAEGNCSFLYANFGAFGALDRWIGNVQKWCWLRTWR